MGANAIDLKVIPAAAGSDDFDAPNTLLVCSGGDDQALTIAKITFRPVKLNEVPFISCSYYFLLC